MPIDLGGTLSHSAESPDGVLSLRQLKGESGFDHVIQCSPHKLTIICSSDEKKLGRFRDDLLGLLSVSALDARFGTRKLRSSEVYLAGESRYQEEKRSVKEIVRAAGAPESVLDSVLETSGLTDVSESRPSELNEASLRALRVTCSLFSKTKVVLYDCPFSGSNTAQIEAMGSLLLEAANASDQIFLILHSGKIPKAFLDNPDISIEELSAHSRKRKRSSITGRGLEETVSAVRNLMQPGNEELREPRESRAIVTRPQKATKTYSRAVLQEAMQSEAIVNPNMEELSRPSEEDETLPKAKRSSSRKKGGQGWKAALTEVSTVEKILLWSNPNSVESFPSASETLPKAKGNISQRKKEKSMLTQVSFLERVLWRSPLFRKLQDMKEQIQKKPYQDHLLPAAKLQASRERYRLRRFVVYSSLIMLIIWAGLFLGSLYGLPGSSLSWSF